MSITVIRCPSTCRNSSCVTHVEHVKTGQVVVGSEDIRLLLLLIVFVFIYSLLWSLILFFLVFNLFLVVLSLRT